MIPVSTLYDEYIGRRKLSEQKKNSRRRPEIQFRIVFLWPDCHLLSFKSQMRAVSNETKL